MNRYQEAIDLLACNSEHWVINRNGLDNKNCEGVFDESDESKLLIQELVDRATPIKPDRDMGSAWCKSCDMFVCLENEDVHFCSYCGQAIDRTDDGK